MYRIIKELLILDKKILYLSEELPDNGFSFAEIDGKLYDVIIPTNSEKCIAITDDIGMKMTGKTVNFIS